MTREDLLDGRITVKLKKYKNPLVFPGHLSIVSLSNETCFEIVLQVTQSKRKYFCIEPVIEKFIIFSCQTKEVEYIRRYPK